MKNLTLNLDTYLLNWYYALPFEALDEIHDNVPNWDELSDHDIDQEIKSLEDDWHNNFDLESKIAYHDDLYDKYYEHTKNITLCEK